MIRSVLSTVSSDTEEKNYKAIWMPVKGFADAVTDLEEVLARIDTLLKVQEGKDGAAAEKAATLQLLGDAAYEIAAATKACATASGNTFLAGSVDFTRSQVTQGRDATVSARCQGILDTASGVADSLKDYGITAAKLAKLQQRIAAFNAVQTKPRQVTSSGSAATRELPELFRQASAVLENRLDGLMVQFKESQPSFYNEYQSARVIVDAASSGRATRNANIVSGTTSTPASKAA